MTTLPSNGADQKLDILIEQVGKLTEGLTEFKIEMQQSMTGFRADLGEIKALMHRQAEAMDKQSEAMDKQAEAMDKQVEAMDKQAEAIRQQVNTTDRLVRIVETLMQR